MSASITSRRHRQVHAALVGRRVHVDDPVAVAGLVRERRVDVVLHRADDPADEADEAARAPASGRSGASCRAARRRSRTGGRRCRLVGLARVVGMEAVQVDRERRPGRERGVEEVHREVARDAAVGEPADLGDERMRGRAAVLDRLDRVAVARAGHVERVERDGADQEREAEAHARGDDDREVLRRGEGPSGASASSRRRARSPSRPSPAGGGCASIQATIRSGNRRRSSCGVEAGARGSPTASGAAGGA